MKIVILSSLIIATITLAGCSFPRPEPGSTEMEMDVNSSEWATMTNKQREMDIAGYDVIN